MSKPKVASKSKVVPVELMRTFRRLYDVITEAAEDAEKFDQGNGAAGGRLRKAMQEVKKTAQQVRNEVTEVRNQRKS